VQGQATLKTAEDRAQFGELARLLQLDIHMEQETIADSDKEEQMEEEVVKPTPEKTRGRPKAKKGGAAQVLKPAAKAESDKEKGGDEAPKEVAGPAAALAAKKVAPPPPPDTSSVESISEILKAAPRVR
jgi:hypothetical protein